MRAVTDLLQCTRRSRLTILRDASRLIDERAIVRQHLARSQRPGVSQASRTTSEYHVTEAAVLPSEIEQLPDLRGYLKIASQPSWLFVALR